jgi:hypothetical protein
VGVNEGVKVRVAVRDRVSDLLGVLVWERERELEGNSLSEVVRVAVREAEILCVASFVFD